MNEFAEDGVFLRRSPNNRERPDRVLAMVNFVHIQYREIMLQTVVAQVITKGAFRHLAIGINRTADTKVGIGVDRSGVCLANHWDAMPC